MSVTVYDGGTVTKDPDASRVYTVDWTADIGSAGIASSSWVIAGPDNALTSDNASIVSGLKMASVRLIGGTLGREYKVTNRIVTNASPAETEDATVTVLIRAQ